MGCYLKHNKQTNRLELRSTDATKQTQDICMAFDIKRHFYSLQEGGLNDYVEFLRYNKKIVEKFYVDASLLSSASSIRTELARHRIHYNEFYSSFIEKYVIEQMNALQVQGLNTYITKKLGWQLIPNSSNYEFLLESKVYPNFGEIAYFDESLKFTKGNMSSQLKFLNNEILPFKETRFALVLGLTSIVASYIEPHKSIGTLVVNVSGQSSTGKSTIAELSASMFADPKTSNYGIVRTFNATKNFILGMSEGRNGLPIILDDANANASEHSKADLIYQFALGESRGRCNSSGDTQVQREGWSGLVIITSESPLLDSENMTQGAKVRTLTIDNMTWTQDANHSDRIKQGVRENFGFIAPEIAMKVKELGLNELLKMHEECTDLIYSKMHIKDHLSNRMASKLASVVITAKILNLYLNSEIISIDEIVDMLVDAEQNGIEKRSIDAKVYDEFLNFVIIHHTHFDQYEHTTEQITKNQSRNMVNTIPNKGDYYGEINYRIKDSEVNIASTVFEKFLKDNKFFEKNTILRNLADKGIVVRGQKDRFVFKPSKNMRCPYYKFIVRSFDNKKLLYTLPSYEEEFDVESTNPYKVDDEELVNSIFDSEGGDIDGQNDVR